MATLSTDESEIADLLDVEHIFNLDDGTEHNFDDGNGVDDEDCFDDGEDDRDLVYDRDCSAYPPSQRKRIRISRRRFAALLKQTFPVPCSCSGRTINDHVRCDAGQRTVVYYRSLNKPEPVDVDARGFSRTFVCSNFNITTVNPMIADYWDWENNLKIDNPVLLPLNSSLRISLSCPNAKCGQHKFVTKICHFTRGHRCRFCANQVICPCPERCNSALAAYPELAAIWHSDNKLRPDEVSPRTSNYQANLICWTGKCPYHVFTRKMIHYATQKRCPYCANRRICPCPSRCNSFAALYPQRVQFWDPTNAKRPDEVNPGAHKLYRFLCTHTTDSDPPAYAVRIRTFLAMKKCYICHAFLPIV